MTLFRVPMVPVARHMGAVATLLSSVVLVIVPVTVMPRQSVESMRQKARVTAR